MNPLRRRTAGAARPRRSRTSSSRASGLPLVLRARRRLLDRHLGRHPAAPRRRRARGASRSTCSGTASSDVGNGDFSLGANASAIRDLLDHLGHERGRTSWATRSAGESACSSPTSSPGASSRSRSSPAAASAPTCGDQLRAASLLRGPSCVLRAASSERSVRAARCGGAAAGRRGIEPRGAEPQGPAPSSRTCATRRPAARRSSRPCAALSAPTASGCRRSRRCRGLDPHRVLIVWGDRDPMLPMQHGRDAHGAAAGQPLRRRARALRTTRTRMRPRARRSTSCSAHTARARRGRCTLTRTVARSGSRTPSERVPGWARGRAR